MLPLTKKVLRWPYFRNVIHTQIRLRWERRNYTIEGVKFMKGKRNLNDWGVIYGSRSVDC